MKSFLSGILTAVNAEESALFYLLELQFDTTIYYTDADIDLAFGGVTYQARGFQMGNINVSSDMGVDSVDVEIDNADLSMSATVLGEDISGLPIILSMCAVPTTVVAGTTGVLYDTAGVPLYDTADEQLIDTTGLASFYYQPIGVQPLFRGLVNNWSLHEDKVRIGIVNELALWAKRTLRPASASCPWEWQGVECGYAGSGGQCNQSYASCLHLGNQANYGGFRFLPAIAETSVWWGRTPK